ncbi:bifunctional metallophosphatase/5'-nucleotidase [Beijerinckia indica]|uniref:5'-Nucleotidase domain protein n=1 Tax=Beijerinckia indica subsp. indica (strain ATCC 9039 / DSM 1715 / NCIMB 8712) TaxID=395963 RepID=B2IFD5_BEII9|nr:5'-nucleotidase C-terminal domain-containing protein [Beijerinckia indica]ACB97035.1 5'-Nucleotidase domain protein [Beijerinckia indica subsp. indica ATCC 9039]
MIHLTRRQTLLSGLAAGTSLFAHASKAADHVTALTFLLVNDLYRIDADAQGRGGFARLTSVVKAERARAAARGAKLICVHAGDALSPSLLSSLDHGAHMITLLNEIGFDAFVPGNHEFDFGPDTYRQRMQEAHFPVLAANLREADGSALPGHENALTITLEGMRIALIGAAYEATPTVSQSGALLFSPTLATIADETRKARAQGADFVAAIVHADRATGRALMDMKGPDLILCGHNHDLHIDFDGRTAFMESAQDANYVLSVDLDLTKNATGLGWWPNFHVADTRQTQPDTDMEGKVQHLLANLAATLAADLARTQSPLDSRTQIVRGEECTIGNLFADAIRQRTGAEAALINGGGIRGNRLYPVDSMLTRKDILAELPFDNKTLVLPIEGKRLLLALENGLSRAEHPSGRFPHVSGLIVEADLTRPPGSRVQQVRINGDPLAPERIYQLATNDYLARGGDGYLMLAGRADITTDSGNRLIAQDVGDYLALKGQVAPQIEGRIVLRRS